MTPSQMAIRYLDRLKTVLDTIDVSAFDQMVKDFLDAYERQARIFIMGNGGSGATASHMVCDMNKGCCTDLEKKFKNVKIFYINEWYKSHTLTHIFFNKYFRYISEVDNLIKKSSFVRRIANRAIHRFAKNLFKGVDNAIVCFDWTDTYFVQQILKIAQLRGFTTVSLPHGDRPYASRLELNNDLKYSDLTSYRTLDIFDYVVVNRRNELGTVVSQIKAIITAEKCRITPRQIVL